MDHSAPGDGAKSPGTGPSGHTAHGEAQRQALICAAYQIIAEEGFEGLRTRDVANRVGVNIATLHYYFPSKEDLIRAVVERLHNEFEHTHTPDLRSTPLDPLANLHQEFADVLYQAETLRTSFIVAQELYLRSQRDPAIRAMLRAMDEHWHGHITTYLMQGVRDGVFRDDLDIDATAWGIMATIKGSVIQLMLDPTFSAEQFYAQIERWLTEHASHPHRHEHAHLHEHHSHQQE